MRINPIVRKDLQIGSRSVKYPIMIMIYNGILAAIALIIIYMMNVGYNQGMGLDTTYLLMLYPILVWIQFGVISVLIPIMTAGSIAGERERQTLDIMLTTKVGTKAIIRGKILSVVQIIMLFIISSVPIMSISFIYGGMSWLQLPLLMAVLCVHCILLGSIGVLCSVLLKRTVVATIVCFVIEGVLYLGGFVILYIKYAMFYVGTTNSGSFSAPSFGAWPFVLLPNPVTTILQIQQHFIGEKGMEYFFEFSANDVFTDFTNKFWVPLSLIIQLAVAYGVYRLAAYLLSPIRKKRKG